MTHAQAALLTVLTILGTWAFIYILLPLVRTNAALDNAADDIAHGDLPHVPTDATLLAQLYASEGTGCEVGAFHTSQMNQKGN